MTKYSIAIAGSTTRTVQCAKNLLESKNFTIPWILTPIAKPIGRKQTITDNPLQVFAKENKLKTIFVKNKVDQDIEAQILDQPKPDFLLVVDFGYIIPDWLLKLPKIAPLNIHPSELPKWRGSSPGQFALLFNKASSAVTLMVMNEKLDQGPIIHQDFFEINSKWNHKDYYQHAFDLICENLDKKIANFARNSQTVTPQPEESPTLIAKRLQKSDSFVPFEYVAMALEGHCPVNFSKLPVLLQQAYKHNGHLALTLERACKAFAPWPGLWTLIPTDKGEKRMKILECELAKLDYEKKLVLNKVQIEGKNPVKWSETEYHNMLL
jgi:methionyl-tRNA formyltransferase